MPMYCYTTDDGTTTEHWFGLGKAPRRIRVNGRNAYRDIAAEHAGPKPRAGIWPKASGALGCAPDQIEASRAEAAANGVPTEFTSDGKAIMTSAKHQKAYAKLYGLCDNDAYY